MRETAAGQLQLLPASRFTFFIERYTPRAGREHSKTIQYAGLHAILELMKAAKLILSFLTIPVTTCTVERSFSERT